MMRDRRPRVHASGAGSIAAAGNVEHAFAHVGDTYGIEAVPLVRALLDYGPVVDDAGIEQFTGREWLIEAIEERLTGGLGTGAPAGAGRWVLVEARAGLGKTTLAAHLSRTWNCACHFFTPRLGGAREWRVALQSLAAQLITRWDLQEEFAPGGMLPGWAGDPARFPAILSAAARVASAQGMQVRIVVDGLEEAAGQGRDLGLPDLLPAGVGIVATFRTGMPPDRLPTADHSPRIVIDADDHKNRTDVRRYLSRQVREDTVAAWLAKHGIDENEFVSRVTERSGGVWVYLRYVLAAIRYGLWTLDDLNGLPAGLAGYYRQHVIGLRSDPTFLDEDLPVLAALAAAQQPVTVEQLSRWTGLQRGLVRSLCGSRYRPFLTVHAVDRVRPPQFAIYHASLREYLSGDASDTDDDPLDLHDLRQAAVTAHRQIADHYLTLLGGLITDPHTGHVHGLTAVLDAPELAESDDQYPLLHLPLHLGRTQRHDELYALLTCRCPAPGSRAGEVWADLHDRTGTLDIYLAQLALARTLTEKRTDHEVARGRPAPTLGQEIVYAWLASTAVSKSSAIPISLLQALVRTRTWDTTRALANASRIHDLQQRAQALIVITPYIIDPVQADRTRRQALTTAIAIRDEGVRAQALVSVAEHLIDPAHLTQALQAVQAIGNEGARAKALVGVAGGFSGSARDQVLMRALQAAQAIPDAWSRKEMLAAIAGRMTDSAQLAQLLEAAQANRYAWEREKLLAVIAGRMTDSAQLRQLLEAAQASHNEWSQAQILAAVAQQITDPAQLMQALQAAQAIKSEGARAKALVAVAGKLSGSARDRVLMQALQAAHTIPMEFSRAEALIAVAGKLSGSARDRVLMQALQIAYATEDEWSRAQALVAVARQMTDPTQLTQILQAAQAIEDRWHRAKALASIVGQLPGTARDEALTQALQTAQAIEDEDAEKEVMLLLAEHLTDPAQLAQVLQAAQAIVDESARAKVLAAVAEQLTDPAQLIQALQAAQAVRYEEDRAKALARVAGQLSGATREETLAQALQAARAIRNVQSRAQALVAVSEQLSGAARDEALTQALHAAQAIDDEWPRVESLIAVAEQLTDPSQLALVLQAAQTIEDKDGRVQVMLGVAEQLSGTAHDEALTQALQTAQAIGDEDGQTKALMSVARQLTNPAQLAQVLQAAQALWDEENRAYVLAVVAEQLTDPAQLIQVLQAAQAIEYEEGRALALAAVARRLTDPAQLAEVLQAAQTIEDEDGHVQVLLGVAEQLSGAARGEVLAQALRAAQAIPMEFSRAEALVAVAGQLSEAARDEVLAQALRAAHGVPTQWLQVNALVEVAEQLSGAARDQVLAQALRAVQAIPSEWEQAHALATVAGQLTDPDHLAQAIRITATQATPQRRRACLLLLTQVANHAEKDPAVFLVLFRIYLRALVPLDLLLEGLTPIFMHVSRLSGTDGLSYVSKVI
ncbi:hypothetical protein ACQP1W_22120 [Spirillospora sp. CA-255316]